MNPETVRQLRGLQQRLTALKVEVGRCLEELTSILLSTPSDLSPLAVPKGKMRVRYGRWLVDRKEFSVSAGKKACFLGNTICFRLLQYLLSHPDHYFTYPELLAAIWGGRRADVTIRGTVFDLRRRLCRSGMTGLANAIRSQRRRCGLIPSAHLR